MSDRKRWIERSWQGYRRMVVPPAAAEALVRANVVEQNEAIAC